jgi:hypothetical protein
MNDAVLDNLLQLFLRHTKRRCDFVQSVHEIHPRDLDILNIVKCRNRADLCHQSKIHPEQRWTYLDMSIEGETRGRFD